MEKFYMQDLQEQQQQKQVKSKKGLQRQIDFSVALSVVIAAFALFSIASFGIINSQKDTVSYAAPAEGFDAIIPELSTDVVGLVGIGGTATDPEGLNVPLYYANSVNANNRVFCVQLRKKAGDGQHYTKEDALATDMGLVYILRNSAANGKSFTGYSGTYSDYAEVWATQAAIWLYLAEKYPDVAAYQFYNKTDADAPHVNASDPDSMVLDTKNALVTATQIQFLGGPHSGDKFNIPGVADAVKSMVAQAKEVAANSASSAQITLSSSADIKKTSDGKFYQTPAIVVTGNPSDAFKSYDVSVSGIDGVKVVDENGNELTLTNIAAGKKFYLRIPASKVTEKTQTLKVLVDGHFTTAAGVYYASGDWQRLIVLDEQDSTDQKGINFDIVGVPDTGMNTAQTIYFIGLIVLLCGIGIVYANTKPVESKQ